LIVLPVSDAHNTFNLFDKKGDGRVSTKELEKVFKSLALQMNDEQLKEWADEMDEEGTPIEKVHVVEHIS
jgi:Ca2+-binding EF-hand superfamily protein